MSSLTPTSTLQTLRIPKFLGMSIFDWVVSLTIAALIGHFLLRLPPSWPLWVTWFIVWTLFGILVHKWFGIHTMLGYYLGLNPMPVRDLKPEKSL